MNANDNDQAGELLIREVDEDLRREQFQKLWQRYGAYIVAVVAAVILAVAGYQGWQSWRNHVRQEESARFSAAMSLIAEGKSDAAMEALDKLGQDSRSGYGLAALMAEAEMKLRAGDGKGAADVYRRLTTLSSVPVVFRDLAQLKLALLSLNGGDKTEDEHEFSALIVTSNPWHYSALEALALTEMQKGNTKHAGELFRQLADDLKAPQGIRARAAEMLEIPGLSDNGAPASGPVAPAAAPAPAPAHADAPAATKDKGR